MSDDQTIAKVDQKAAEEVVKAAGKPQPVADFIFDVKSKLWFKNDWGMVLTTAPICLELLGSCNLIANRKESADVILVPPQKGFEYLKGYKFLGAALVEVSNKGKLSFMTAAQNMELINNYSDAIKDNVYNILQQVQDPACEVDVVQINLKHLLNFSKRCEKAAKSMQDAFTNWLLYVMELHEACRDSEGEVGVQTRKYADKAAALKFLADEEEKQLTFRKKLMEDMEKEMAVNREAYQEKLRTFPNGDTLLKQQLLMTAADTAANLVGILGTAAACYASPASAFAFGAKELADKKSGESGSAAEPAALPAPKKLEDPLLSKCESIRQTLTQLEAIVTGPKGVDWDLVTSGVSTDPEEDDKKPSKKDEKPTPAPAKPSLFGKKEGGEEKPAKPSLFGKKEGADEKPEKPSLFGKKEGANSKEDKEEKAPAKEEPKKEKEPEPKAKASKEGKLSIGSIAFVLSADRVTIKKAQDSDVKTDLLKVMRKSMEVVEGLQEQAAKAKKLNEKWTPLTKDSEAVKEWVVLMTDSMEIITKLAAEAGSGGATSGRPTFIVAPYHDPDGKEKVKAKTDLNKSTIDAARIGLEITQKGYHQSLELVQNSSDKVAEVQDKLTSLRSDMEIMGQQKVTLENVREVLQACIGFLIDLKARIMDLTGFFATLSMLISAAVEREVMPFNDYVELALQKKISGQLVSEYLLTTILHYTVTIASNFDLYKDISQMYCDVHSAHIVSGFNLVDALGAAAGTPGDTDKKREKLKQYATDAPPRIRAIINKVSDNIREGLKDRIKTIDDLLVAVPPLPENLKKAITQGSEAATQTVKERIEDPARNSGIEFLTMSRADRQKAAKNMGFAY